MDSLRDELLLDVNRIQKIGMPGRIAVLGTKAVVIATGMEEQDAILAAGQLDKGRVIAFGHGGYGEQLCDPNPDNPNSALYRNVRNWLAGKKLANSFKVLKLDNAAPLDLNDLRVHDFVLSLASKETTEAKVLEQYVRQGGGLAVATTPWGQLQLNPDKKAYEIPYGDLLIDVGIIFCPGIATDHSGGFATGLNRAEEANLDSCMRKCDNNVNSMVDKVGLISCILYLPPKYLDKFKKDFQNNWKAVNEKVVKTFPSGSVKTKNNYERKVLDLWFFCSQIQATTDFKAYGIAKFPGDFDGKPELSDKTVNFTSEREDYYYTGCYLPAGRTAQINVSKLTNTWSVIVGFHTDVLDSVEVMRWPNVSTCTEITKLGSWQLTSPFGGSVVFQSPKQNLNSIEAKISGIALCPSFDLLSGNGSKDWKASRDRPGLWAEVSGKHMTIVLPSSSVRAVDDPREVAELYDKLLLSYHDLRGTDINKERRMCIVTDAQPVAGYMHAGYPIVTQMDVADPTNVDFLLNAQSMKKYGFWGVFHEMGHNMQQNQWTFAGTREVTTNIFTLYGMEVLCGIDPWEHPWLKKQNLSAKSYLLQGSDFGKWKSSPGLALYFYAQLAHSFKWDAYKRVFRRYQALNQQQAPSRDQDKIDTWFLIFSEEVKFNLAPIAVFWGFPISDAGMSKLSALNLQPFLPDDEITNAVSTRVKFVKEKFPTLVRSS